MLNEGKDADRYADGPTPTDEELAKYREAVAQYEQGMNTLIDDNKAHVLSKEIVFTGTNFIKQGQTEDKWKAYEQEVKNEFSRC